MGLPDARDAVVFEDRVGRDDVEAALQCLRRHQAVEGSRWCQGSDSSVSRITRGAYQLEPFSSEDVGHARRIMERYADLRVGLADASVVVLAHRHRTLELLCTDERHFRALKGTGGKPFRLLPVDA